MPTLWDARDGVRQVVFPGAHSDVGGGYPSPECGLSNGALRWMASELEELGVSLCNTPPLVNGDASGIGHRPWASGVFALRPHSPRSVLDTFHGTGQLLFHSSVQARLAAARSVWAPDDGTTAYTPTVLGTVIKSNTSWVSP